jgi:hypothetical protein
MAIDPVTAFTGISAGFEMLKKGLDLYKDAAALKDPKIVRERMQELQSQALDLKDQVLQMRALTLDQKEGQRAGECSGANCGPDAGGSEKGCTWPLDHTGCVRSDRQGMGLRDFQCPVCKFEHSLRRR